MVIEVQPLCECECQKLFAQKSDICSDRHPLCNSQGELVCGTCKCCENFFGDKCQCSNGTMNDLQNPDLGCRKEYNVTIDTSIRLRHGTICSGRGDCECGKCRCYEQSDCVIISGEFCDKV